MEISILCKVVDNYGDIGVAYRLSRQLQKISKANINLIVDDLQAFNKICNTVSPEKSFQIVEGISVYINMMKLSAQDIQLLYVNMR